MVSSDANPVAAETGSENRMCRKHFRARAPDLVSASPFACALGADLGGRRREIPGKTIAANP